MPYLTIVVLAYEHYDFILEIIDIIDFTTFCLLNFFDAKKAYESRTVLAVVTMRRDISTRTKVSLVAV